MTAKKAALFVGQTYAYLHEDGALAQVNGGGTPEYLLDDALGSRRGVTDLAGTLTGTADYDTFGAVRTSTGTGSVFGFTGEQSDAETGYTYLRARYLNPATGRFTSADSVQPNAPGTQGYNLYAYVANNPTTWVDPSGHDVGTEVPAEIQRIIEEIEEFLKQQRSRQPGTPPPQLPEEHLRLLGAWAGSAAAYIGAIVQAHPLIALGLCICIAATILICAFFVDCLDVFVDVWRRINPFPQGQPEEEQPPQPPQPPKPPQPQGRCSTVPPFPDINLARINQHVIPRHGAQSTEPGGKFYWSTASELQAVISLGALLAWERWTDDGGGCVVNQRMPTSIGYEDSGRTIATDCMYIVLKPFAPYSLTTAFPITRYPTDGRLMCAP